jgi:hypothetical protein
LAVDPARQDKEQKLPRLQDEVQGSPEKAGGNPQYAVSPAACQSAESALISILQTLPRCKVEVRLNN